MTWRFAVAGFKYAVNCVLERVKEIRKEYEQQGLEADYIKKMCDNYGYGFVHGSNKAFKKAAGRKK